MAQQTIQLTLAEAGINMRAQVYAGEAATTVGTANVSVTSIAPGVYQLTLTDSAGVYRVHLEDTDDSNRQFGVVFVKTTNTAARFHAVSELALLDVAALTASALSGANLVTLTVVDEDSDPVQNATVRMVQGVNSEAKRTNASGVVSFTVDDGTWSVRIDAAGLTFEDTTLSVTGDTTHTYTMETRVTVGDNYATGDDLVAYYDAKTIGMMLLDNGTSVAAASVADHAIVERMLLLASGSVNAALMASKRYTSVDLTTLSEPSAEHLRQIVCDVAMYHLSRRRMDTNTDRTEAMRKLAEAHLERLRKGELILEVDAVKDAGVMDHATLTQADLTSGVELVRDRVGYYPQRRTSRG